MRIAKALIDEYEFAIDSYGLRNTWRAYTAHMIDILRPDLSVEELPNVNVASEPPPLIFSGGFLVLLTSLPRTRALGVCDW